MTGTTSLLYKGSDGTSRSINPDNYQPKGSYAAASHNHSASNITSGTLAVARGGTGQTSVDTTPTSGSKKMCTSGGIYTAINDLKTSVSNGKSAVASAITDKGVSTSATASFDTMASNIRSINQYAPVLLYTNTNVSAGMENNTSITLSNVNFIAFLIEFKYTAIQWYFDDGSPCGDKDSSAIIYYTKTQLNTGGEAGYVSGGPMENDGLIYTNLYPTYRKDIKLTNNILNFGRGGYTDSYKPHLDSYNCCIPYRVWGINISL